MLFQNLYEHIWVHKKLKMQQGNPLINSLRTLFTPQAQNMLEVDPISPRQ